MSNSSRVSQKPRVEARTPADRRPKIRGHRSRNRDQVRKWGVRNQKLDGNWKLGVRTLGPETRQSNEEETGWIPCAPSPGGSRSCGEGGATHQVALRGDADEDEVIPNSDLLSF